MVTIIHIIYVVTTPKSTTSVYTKPKLGVVPQCTLTKNYRKYFTYYGRTYCMVYYGERNHNAAIDLCKKRNAGLPLPKSKKEVDEFLKITSPFYGWGSSTPVWIGLTDVTKSGNKAAWKDVEGNPIGNRYVNLRVVNLMDHEINVITDPA